MGLSVPVRSPDERRCAFPCGSAGGRSHARLVALDYGDRIAYQAVKHNRGYKAMSLERIPT